MGKKKYGVIYDKNGKSIGVSGPVGPIGIQGACSHPGPRGVAGPPGGGPPYVGQFRWCQSCGHVLFVRVEEKNRYWSPGESKEVFCSMCGGETTHVHDVWCPEHSILVWEEEVVQ